MTKRQISRFLPAALACLAIGLAAPQDAWAANEKGPRCSDGIDNDGDGLVDGADPDCGGSDDGSSGDSTAKTPAKITFDDSITLTGDNTGAPEFSGIRSDRLFPNTVQGVSGGSYDGPPDSGDLEVFIGSQGNYGNIYFTTRTNQPPATPNVIRDLEMALPADAAAACGLPAKATVYDLHFANASPADHTPDGLFGIREGETRTAPMVIRFHNAGETYTLTFDEIEKGNSNCKGLSSSVLIERLNQTQWRVSSNGPACLEHYTGKGKNDFCGGGEVSFTYIIEDISAP